MKYASPPAWTMKGRYSSKKLQICPSSTSYSPKNICMRKDPAWKMETSSRKEMASKNGVPGPGKYEIRSLENSKAFGIIGKENLLHLEKPNEIPGPGTYEVVKKRPSSPCISFAKKYDVVGSSVYPGPGAYEYKMVKKISSINFGKQLRFAESKEPGQIPGPGTYDFSRPQSAKTSFTRENRNCGSPFKPDEAPGPGNYQAISIFQGKPDKGYSIQGKCLAQLTQKNPGPGSYEPYDPLLNISPKVTIGKKCSSRKTDQIPGPHKYFPVNETFCSKRYSIGKATRQPLYAKKEVPGPGTYDCLKKISGPQYSLGISRKFEPTEPNPGPGMYNPNRNFTKQRPQSANIGKSQRILQLNTVAPGPGTYEAVDLHSNSPPKCVFPKETRIVQKHDPFPGPGQYQIPTTIANCPSYTK